MKVPIKAVGGKIVGWHYLNDARVVAITYLCHGCGDEIAEDVVVWAREDGTRDTDMGYAYCDGCLPPDPSDKD